MDIKEALEQMMAPLQRKDAYNTGVQAFNYRLAILIIRELERENPGTKQRVLSELENYARESQQVFHRGLDPDLQSLAQEMQRAVDEYLEHLREELR